VLPSCVQVIEGDLIVGGAVGFDLFVLLPPGNDDVAGVLANVDDGAEVARGAVEEVALPRLVHLDHAVLAFNALCVDDFAAFLLDIICIFYFHGVWKIETHGHIHALIEKVRDVVVVVVV
jgi:hypothetical protein